MGIIEALSALLAVLVAAVTRVVQVLVKSISAELALVV
jgi:hypothetical protein